MFLYLTLLIQEILRRLLYLILLDEYLMEISEIYLYLLLELYGLLTSLLFVNLRQV